jgi:hypothetical protein
VQGLVFVHVGQRRAELLRPGHDYGAFGQENFLSSLLLQSHREISTLTQLHDNTDHQLADAVLSFLVKEKILVAHHPRMLKLLHGLQFLESKVRLRRVCA